MRLLLDTHTLIWFLSGDEQLPDPIAEKIRDYHNACYVSIASFWEMAIKTNLGKLYMGMSFDELGRILYENNIEVLPVMFDHFDFLQSLEFHHRDPFDRIIISQALADQFTIVTRDEAFKKYPVKLMW